MSLKKRFNIDVFVRHEVLSIDKVNKTVSVLNHNTNETFVESYDYLVLATGAKPIIPGFCKGKKNIFTVKTVEDATSLKKHLVNNNVKSAVVIGGGYIGIEMAENLSNIGIKTSLVELNNHLLAISTLIETGNMEQAKHYISEVSEQLDLVAIPIKTGRDVLDALLFKKTEQADLLLVKINYEKYSEWV